MSNQPPRENVDGSLEHSRPRSLGKSAGYHLLGVTSWGEVVDVLLARDGHPDRIRQIYSLGWISALATFALAACAAILVAEHGPSWMTPSWILLMLMVSASELMQHIRVRPERIRRFSDRWRVHLIVFAFVISAAWVPFAYVAVTAPPGPSQVLGLMVLLTMITGHGIVLAFMPILPLITTTVVTVPTLGFLTFGPSQLDPYVSVLFPSVATLLFVFSFRFSAMIRRSELREEERIRVTSALAEAQEGIRRLAETDSLTGLMNRRAFMEVLDDIAAAPPPQSDEHYACVLIDLDHFKQINDSYGHGVGDEYLAQVGSWLASATSHWGSVARLGGDEFAIVSNDRVPMARVQVLGDEVAEALAQTVRIGEQTIVGSGSVGVALLPLHASTVSDWVRYADHSLRQAKRGDWSTARLFTEQDRQSLVKSTSLTRQLELAVERRDIGPRYQPQFCIETGRIVGVEALARWLSPIGAGVSPPEFFALAESAGFVNDLSELMFERVGEDVRRLSSDGLDVGRVSVNLHPLQLRQQERLIAAVERLAEAVGGTGRVVLEVTEDSVVGRGTEAVPELLRFLSASGFEISLDDFGTGYASLTHLKELPTTELKIDRKFITNIEQSEVDRSIVRSVVDIARATQTRVVAEGIETISQLFTLEQLGVSVGQGYVFSPAVAADQLGIEFERGCGDRAWILEASSSV